jgi:hypothetical protein
MQQLSDGFLIELFKFALTDVSFIEVAAKDLKYQYLPTETYKKIWKEIVQTYELTNSLPTIGILSERFKNDSQIKSTLVEIKKQTIGDKKDLILQQLERYIKETRFVELYTKVGEMFNDSKREEAISLLAKESEQIVQYSLRKGMAVRIFADFEKRQAARIQNNETSEIKIPFGIHALDTYTYGGISLGTAALVLARSGVGKSTALRWVGLNAARNGYRVVHFQCEGTEREVTDAYDAAWTGISLRQIEFGEIPKEKEQKLKKINQTLIRDRGEIHIIASETFDSMYIEDCNDRIEEIENTFGKVHLILFDYLEIFNIKGKYNADGEGKRIKMEKIGNKIVNMAVKFNAAALTAIQANDIKPDKWDSPDYVMTRSDISEFKGALKPFSYFFTLNQTNDEYTNEVMRIHCDKFRKYRSGQTFRIFQALDNSRFYDINRTLEHFWDENAKSARK